jgi:hypothetical protein
MYIGRPNLSVLLVGIARERQIALTEGGIGTTNDKAIFSTPASLKRASTVVSFGEGRGPSSTMIASALTPKIPGPLVSQFFGVRLGLNPIAQSNIFCCALLILTPASDATTLAALGAVGDGT